MVAAEPCQVKVGGNIPPNKLVVTKEETDLEIREQMNTEALQDLRELWKSITKSSEQQEKHKEDWTKYWKKQDEIDRLEVEIIADYPFLQRFNNKGRRPILSDLRELEKLAQKNRVDNLITERKNNLKNIGMADEEIEDADLSKSYDNRERNDKLSQLKEDFENLLHNFLDHYFHGNSTNFVSDFRTESIRGNYSAKWDTILG